MDPLRRWCSVYEDGSPRNVHASQSAIRTDRLWRWCYPELTKLFLKISCLGCTFRQIYTPGLCTRRPYVHSMYSRRPNPELAAGNLQARHRLGLLSSHLDRNTRWRWLALRGSEAICHDAARSLTASALVIVRLPSAARRFCSSSSQPEKSRAPPLVHARSQHILQISTST